MHRERGLTSAITAQHCRAKFVDGDHICVWLHCAYDETQWSMRVAFRWTFGAEFRRADDDKCTLAFSDDIFGEAMAHFLGANEFLQLQTGQLVAFVHTLFSIKPLKTMQYVVLWIELVENKTKNHISSCCKIPDSPNSLETAGCNSYDQSCHTISVVFAFDCRIPSNGEIWCCAIWCAHNLHGCQCCCDEHLKEEGKSNAVWIVC